MWCEPDDRILEIDIKDFHMEGAHDFLRNHTFEFIDNCLERDAYREVLWWTLHHQYVHEQSSDSHYSVSKGSGMGTISSDRSAMRPSTT